jgi:hypothetical protein
VQAALRDWQQVRQVAGELGEKGWENRCRRRTRVDRFLKGNTGEATKEVQQALEIARAFGDFAGERRYLSAMANGPEDAAIEVMKRIVTGDLPPGARELLESHLVPPVPRSLSTPDARTTPTAPRESPSPSSLRQ